MGAPFFVYILASKRNGTLYVGVTNNLARRLSEHKAKLVPGFTRQYEVDQLVYFEAFDSIHREGRCTASGTGWICAPSLRGLRVILDRRARANQIAVAIDIVDASDRTPVFV